MKKLLPIIVILFLSNRVMPQDLTQYVNCLSGTSNWTNTFPGATAPFGMIQWSPETEDGTQPSGYYFPDTKISGFGVDHISGAGCTYGGNFLFMPILNSEQTAPPSSRKAFAAEFLHSNESPKPGYYSVKLSNGIKVELTTSIRSGLGRISYPANGPLTIMINTASAINKASASSVHIDTSGQFISGSARSKIFCGRTAGTTIYFYATFDKPFTSFSTWSGSILTKGRTDGQGTSSGAFISFDTTKGKTLHMRISISYVSVANAKENLLAECPDSSFTPEGFDRAVTENVNRWNKYLSKIEITSGTAEQTKTFYTMMYHALLAPTVCSDVNGDYMGYDGKVHKTENGRRQYANFSGWDIYRSECQFLAMMAPEEAGDMAQSLLLDYQQGGAFPRWGVPNDDSGVMIGDPSAAIIAGFYAFGARNFNTNGALTGLLKAATDPTVRSINNNINERDALVDYLGLGYVPEGQSGGYGNVSMTLEYASADFALSEFAKALGDSVNSLKMLKQSQSWRRLYNPATGYIQMKRREGTWAPGFVNNNDTYDNNRAYVEGSASQYLWMVPFNLRELTSLMGGPGVAAKRLDYFFTNLNATRNSEFSCLSNEPSFSAPWVYDFIGMPYKTQNVMRQVITKLFSMGSYPGSDDLGEMSSFYILGALGFYPELPGSDVLVLGSPLYTKAVIHLKNGDLTITGNGAGTNSPYVQSLKINGANWTKPWVRFSEVQSGAEMVYELGPLPNTSFGSDLKDAPPSYPASTLGIPELLSPATGDTLGINDSLLIWHKLNRALSYRLQISASNTFAVNDIDISGLKDTTLSIKSYFNDIVRYPVPVNTHLNYKTKYYWRVSGETLSEAGSYSEAGSFVSPDKQTGVNDINMDAPKSYELKQNYPNPFNPSTTISYSLAETGFVRLRVFNILGKEVKSLINREQNAGSYKINFDTNGLTSGVYFYELNSNGFSQTRKMILAR